MVFIKEKRSYKHQIKNLRFVDLYLEQYFYVVWNYYIPNTFIITHECLFEGLTWLFGFLVIIPTPANLQYLNFIFAFLFCIFNAFQGVFIFTWTVMLKLLELKHISKLLKRNISEEQTNNGSDEFDLSAIVVEYRIKKN